MRYKTLRCGAMIVLVTSLLSCGNDEGPVGPHATPVLLPLAIGNAWAYRVNGAVEGIGGEIPTVSVTGTMTIAGGTYYSMEIPNLGPPPGLRSSSEVAGATLLQNRPDGLFLAHYDDQQGFSDDLLFKFPLPGMAQEGNTGTTRSLRYEYRRQSGEAVQMRVQHVQVTVAERTFDCLEYRIVGDDRFFAAFAVDVGCVRAFGLFWPGRLIELDHSR